MGLKDYHFFIYASIFWFLAGSVDIYLHGFSDYLLVYIAASHGYFRLAHLQADTNQLFNPD